MHVAADEAGHYTENLLTKSEERRKKLHALIKPLGEEVIEKSEELTNSIKNFEQNYGLTL